MNSRIAVTLLLAALPHLALAQEDAPKDPLELSGYVQARYVWAEASTHADVEDGFTVRRGRLKAKYDLEWSAYLLQIDATPKGVSLKDAEVHLVEPWTGYKLALIAGQTKWPFGFEVGQSSSQREFPERSRVVRAFAAGERDRGAKLVAKVGALRFTGGVFDGNGVDDRAAGGVDNDRYKDVVGRAGFEWGKLSGGLSGWYGNTRRDEETSRRTRIGADLQLSAALLPWGPSSLRLEAIRGDTYFKSGVEQAGLPAFGWYALLSQRLGEKSSVALRYDYFDPLLGTEAADLQGAWGLAVMHDWNKHLELTAAFEVPEAGLSEGFDKALLTLQAQAKF